jgi:hypothetical protein
MALEVFEQKAGRRPAGGYSISVPTRSHSGELRGDTVLRRPTLRPGPRAAGQMSGRRQSTARPVLGPMRALKSRTIF